MKWFKRKHNIKKRDEHSTYLKVENGRVVPVTGDEPAEHTPEKEPYQFEEKDVIEPEEESRGTKGMKWLWLLLIIALGYGTIQLVAGLATENKEVFKLQEIQRNTLQIPEEPADKAPEKSDDPSSKEPSNPIVDKTSEWRKELQDSFTEDSPKEETPQPPVSDVPEPVGINPHDKNLLFAIRSLDEQGTALLEQIRDASVSFIHGDISRGQYLLKLQSVELKIKRYNEEIYSVQQQIDSNQSYANLMEYVTVKKDSLSSLDTELRLASTNSIAPVFNSYVDIHNELTLEADKEFVRQLQQLGYEAEIRNGIIEYR